MCPIQGRISESQSKHQCLHGKAYVFFFRIYFWSFFVADDVTVLASGRSYYKQVTNTLFFNITFRPLNWFLHPTGIVPLIIFCPWRHFYGSKKIIEYFWWLVLSEFSCSESPNNICVVVICRKNTFLYSLLKYLKTKKRKTKKRNETIFQCKCHFDLVTVEIQLGHHNLHY